MAKVVLEHVRKVFDGGVVAVEDFNLEIADREFIVLVGPSGCGKSTTLRMVAGLEEISGGTISIDGKVVNDMPPKDRDIAMVFQNYALYPHMSVFDNMAFGLKLRHMPKGETMERVHEAADILGIRDLLTRRPKQLSGGQRQRVAVGRAIVRKPKVFLFDEPLSNLDAKMRVQMRVEISRLHQRLGATMIYVTHDQVEAMTMGDRIVVMEKGHIQQVAGPLELYEKPANRFVAGFIGMPPMNFLTGSLVKCDGGLVFRTERDEKDGRDIMDYCSASRPLSPLSPLCPLAVELPLPKNWSLASHEGQRVTLGMRPEDVGSATAERATDSPRLQATVDVVEPMGSETYVYVKVAGTTLICRVDAHRIFKEGETVELPVDIQRCHVFDEDGEALKKG